MKSQHYIIALLLLFTSTLAVNAQTTKEQLVGTWALNFEASKLKMETSAKDIHNRMDTTRKDRLEKAYKGRKISFNVDGRFSQELADGREVSGSWVLNKNEKEITINYTNGKQQFYNIKSLNFNSLVLKPETNGTKKMILSEWHFTKN